MKRKNATRSALFTSIISLLLCVSMLVGATFAWFTDNVQSGMNTIAAGNLDVELYHSDKNDSGYVDVNTLLFNDVALWEPGVVAYENFVVENKGNLALKYRLSINFENETVVNGHGLSEALQVAVVDGGFNGGREDAQTLTNLVPLKSFVESGVLEGDTKSETYGIVIYWQPGDDAIDNLFNMKNVEKNADGSAVESLTIDLGVNLFATQEMYEEDSFGEDYDKGATPAELPVVKVSSFGELDSALKAMTEPTVIDATGADLIIEDQFYNIPGGATIKGGNILCADGNGTFLVAVTGVGETVTFDGCTIKQTRYKNLSFCSEADGADLIFNGCTLLGKIQPNLTEKATGTSQFNACTFKLGEGSGPDGIGFVNCMGGMNTFSECSFDYTGGWTMGSNQFVRYNAVNSFSERYSTSVVLEGCTFINCSTQKYGANSTLTVK